MADSEPPTLAGGSPKSAIDELRELGLTIDLQPDIAAKIWSRLLIISGQYFQGAYHRDSPSDQYPVKHFYDAYRAIATRIVAGSTSDDVLENVIPTTILNFQKKMKWLGWPGLDIMKTRLHGPIEEWRGRRLMMAATADSPAIVAPHQGTDENHASVPAIPKGALPSIADQLESLRVKTDMKQEALAELVRLDVRTVQRHLSGDTKPNKRLIYRYEKVFSKLLDTHVVIGKLP